MRVYYNNFCAQKVTQISLCHDFFWSTMVGARVQTRNTIKVRFHMETVSVSLCFFDQKDVSHACDKNHEEKEHGRKGASKLWCSYSARVRIVWV